MTSIWVLDPDALSDHAAQLKWIQRKKPSEMLTARLPGRGASIFCGCSSCCSCTMEEKLKSWASQCSPQELSAWRGMLFCSKGQNEAEKGWCCPGQVILHHFFPHHTRTVLAASRLPRAGQPSPCCTFLPICHKHTPEYWLWGPQAHVHVPSLPLLRQIQNCT